MPVRDIFNYNTNIIWNNEIPLVISTGTFGGLCLRTLALYGRYKKNTMQCFRKYSFYYKLFFDIMYMEEICSRFFTQGCTSTWFTERWKICRQLMLPWKNHRNNKHLNKLKMWSNRLVKSENLWSWRTTTLPPMWTVSLILQCTHQNSATNEPDSTQTACLPTWDLLHKLFTPELPA